VHAFAETLDQPQYSRRPAVAIAAKDLQDTPLDRIDQSGRLGAQAHDEFIEPFEPSHLQQFRSRYVKDKGSDADAEELGEENGGNGAEPIFMGEQPEADQLQRK
jgi:hypothetical protein